MWQMHGPLVPRDAAQRHRATLGCPRVLPGRLVQERRGNKTWSPTSAHTHVFGSLLKIPDIDEGFTVHLLPPGQGGGSATCLEGNGAMPRVPAPRTCYTLWAPAPSMHPWAAELAFSSILQLHEGHHLFPGYVGQWDQSKKPHMRKVGAEKHSDQRAASSQSNLLPPFSEQQSPEALPAVPARAVFSCPALPKQTAAAPQPPLLRRNGLRLSRPHLKPHTAFVSALGEGTDTSKKKRLCDSSLTRLSP